MSIFFAKVDKDYTSQQCPECGTYTGKKERDQPIHACWVCFYTVSRDVAAAQVIRNRGLEIISGSGSGHDLKIKQIVCGLDAALTSVTSLAGTGRSRKLKK
ncbi:zinc ribbon domain-containing protein [Nostoc sp. ChiQUE01b]|uniref:zinc ribbon domain-containing protein n=1 Tax=Nostoc sp. ChiQUE01b TaxID=3075376 RepID=UPI002AD33F8F|nr:zinc ribbon domain-containing protein [Nostoc sp. ChiQUE01b]MDZ8257365.1 zinc ribbon domain-containing protein [Nostoc sp. ChiQUE01b]